MRVDFFIAGVQKGGTTALDLMLRRHARIQMASRKEPHYFDNDTVDWQSRDYGPLHQHFDWTVDGVVRGEATPIYSFWPNAMERLWRYNPQAQIVIALRHPTERAFSHWRMETTRRNETLTFSMAIREGRERVRAAAGGVHRVYSYVERGFYAAQAKRILSLFHRDQVIFLRTDQLWCDPQETFDQVCAFLGLDPAQAPSPGSHVAPLHSADLGAMDRTDRIELAGLFESDIRQASAITGLDLDDWLDPDYREPMSQGTA